MTPLAGIALSVFSLLSTSADSATVAPRRPVQDPTFTADSRLVLLPVTVLDRRGATVTGLTSDAFEVLEDDTPQIIASFGRDEAPVSVTVVLDVSASMQSVLPEARAALKAFAASANPDDEAGLLTVSSRPSRAFGFATDIGRIPAAAAFAGAGGNTALVDAVYAALRESRAARNGRRAILIVSDGMDNNSRYTKSELIAAAVEADVQIYSIAVYAPALTKKAIELGEERKGLALLEELARRTGGVSLVARGENDIQPAADAIGRALREQYLIGYTPDGADAGKWHSIRIRMRNPGTRVWTRSRFYAP